MAILDAVIILFLLMGAVLGFKKGFIKSLVSLIGVILVLIISFYLKNPIANFMIKYLPFLNFTGKFAGLIALNIFLYEALAFLLVFAILSSILAIIIKISGIIEKLLNATIILGIISKILGAITGVLEMTVFIFVAVFVMSQFAITNQLVTESSVAKNIIVKTPILSNITSKNYVAAKDVLALQEKYANVDDKSAYNIEAISIMVKYGVVDKEVVQYIINNNKIKLEGVVFY